MTSRIVRQDAHFPLASFLQLLRQTRPAQPAVTRSVYADKDDAVSVNGAVRFDSGSRWGGVNAELGDAASGSGGAGGAGGEGSREGSVDAGDGNVDL